MRIIRIRCPSRVVRTLAVDTIPFTVEDPCDAFDIEATIVWMMIVSIASCLHMSNSEGDTNEEHVHGISLLRHLLVSLGTRCSFAAARHKKAFYKLSFCIVLDLLPNKNKLQ
jgi:hypothetical protein